MLLDCIICQMYEFVLDLVDVICLATHADVALFETIAFVLMRDHYPETYVKLSLIDEKGLLDVLLKDKDV